MENNEKITIYIFNVFEEISGLESKEYYFSGNSEEEATEKLISIYGDDKDEILKAIEDGIIVISILEYD